MSLIGVVATLLLAACGSTSATTTTGTTAPAATSAAPPAATAAVGSGTTATAAPPPAPTAPAAPAATAASPLDAGAYGTVNAAAAELLAAPAGIDEATSRCATSGDCAEIQTIAAKVRAAETKLSVLLLSAGAGVQRGTPCQQVITDLSDAVVHRYLGRLDDFFARTTQANAQRLTDAGTRVGQVADEFKTACAPSGS